MMISKDAAKPPLPVPETARNNYTKGIYGALFPFPPVRSQGKGKGAAASPDFKTSTHSIDSAAPRDGGDRVRLEARHDR